MRHSRFLWIVAAAALFAPASTIRAAVPDWLPRYDVQFELDVARRELAGHMQATWFNHFQRPVHELVFNAHSHYVVPDSEIGFDAKMLEMIRMNASECLGGDKPPCDVDAITLAGDKPINLAFHYEGDTNTTLVVNLPFALQPGQSVTIDLAFRFHIPPKQGRWGQWRNITSLTNWLPVFAVFDERQADNPVPLPGTPGKEVVGEEHRPISKCWQPTPFVPWHLPFCNDAGIYHVRATLPCNQNVGCSGNVVAATDLGDGRQQLDFVAEGVRDFAFFCSDKYCAWEDVVPEQPGVPAPIKVRVLAYREHEFYAKEMVRVACEALVAYSQWFGPYPYPVFTVTESYFGWNGNQCGALVMIDERVFAMPHMATKFLDSLLSHEVCHQWWYNLVGTNGYCETWMSEALASYYANKLQNRKWGLNNNLIDYPSGLEWAPNIRREDYRSYSLYGCLGRGDNSPVVQEMPKFKHLANLFSMCYDKGSRIVGMIEERMTEPGFASFMRVIFKKYQYRVLRVADYQRELEEFTGDTRGDWDRFFKQWLYGVGLSDWAVKKVEVHGRVATLYPDWLPRPPVQAIFPKCSSAANPVSITVHLKQCGAITERTWLGFALPGHEGYPIRIPIIPDADPYRLEEPSCEVIPEENNEVRVEIRLPVEPEQIAVDPDQILVDTNPANNFWKPPIHWRVTPLYTFLDETDLTCAYDRWNVIVGPWVYGTAYNDAWYTRSAMFGARAGLYRTADFDGGVYTAYRTDFRDVVLGADGLWDHWPYPNTQIGFNVERRLAEGESGEDQAFRASGFARYVLMPSDSLYLLPSHFVEVFSSYQDNFFPFAENPPPNSERFEHATTMGIHYNVDYRTPYWTPEGGFLIDASYQVGSADLDDRQHGIQLLTAEAAITKGVPDLLPYLAWAPPMQDALRPFLEWLGDSQVAVRGYGAIGFPSRGLFYSLGGSDLLRGFDLADRQGNAIWVASVEWRMPLARGLTWDCFDHILGLRNVYGAVFYDVGDAYSGNRSEGPIAQAVGGGLRLDVSWLSLVERTTFRFDVAKTVNYDTPWQLWVGVGYPF